jgi:hypothetical protein
MNQFGTNLVRPRERSVGNEGIGETRIGVRVLSALGILQVEG